MDKFHPGYFGKLGMRSFHLKRGTTYCPGVNIDRLWSFIPSEVSGRAKASPSDKNAPIIDVTKAGFFKVLGKVRLPKPGAIVRAKFFSKRVEDKIKAAGGVCELVA